ncbi:bifunctional diaminohydroxyphosphoribosylaminopyrimidine deaminase/5-amino-6-(5-phosphoribosylamino)uracil reductase RibD [Puniceicoccaceae bacterium K14]|nr:bifunctional diaminohydroxyphosphoribosylaminopyrimidine deaminase/5-amino-6-(5-phosphoribosylamino)uracil reductase RibD [Puniceicoccaceae bacterium K14]
MRLAINEAMKADVALTHPNPRVGAVIVENGEVVASGYHIKNGEPHAERNALMALGRQPIHGASMYVTLEPCSTRGRTGACTDAIIEAGIESVIIGTLDPTPAHRGNAVAVLEGAGISVVTEVLPEECEAVNPNFGGHET